MKQALKPLFFLLGLTFAAAQVVHAETTQNDSTETTGQYANASSITAKVKSALLAKKGLDSTKISVQSETVENNKTIVLLTGTQKTQTQIDLAVATTKQVKGVTKVVNKLSIGE